MIVSIVTALVYNYIILRILWYDKNWPLFIPKVWSSLPMSHNKVQCCHVGLVACCVYVVWVCVVGICCGYVLCICVVCMCCVYVLCVCVMGMCCGYALWVCVLGMRCVLCCGYVFCVVFYVRSI